MDPLSIIERIIEDHKVIQEKLQHLDRAANDAEVIMAFDKAKEVFMPGRLGQHQGLKMLHSLMETAEKGIDRHFNFEEEWLPDLVGRYGNEEVVSNWESILLEHKDLRSRFAHARKHAVELIEENLSRHLWEASAHDMRAYITHTRKLMEAHLQIEQDLLHEIRNQVKKKA